jgi:acetyl esterase/lipase
LLWLKDAGAKQFSADPSEGFIVRGYSAGKNIATVLLEYAQDQALSPPLTGGFLCIPHLLVEEIVPAPYKEQWTSREENANDPHFNRAAVAQVLEALEPDVHSPWFSPFNSPTLHRGLAPVYIQAGNHDVLRDDALIYAKVLQDAGVTVRIDNYPTLGYEA